MAFQIALFVYTGENEVINKEPMLTERFNLDGNLKENTSIINPSILIEKNDIPLRYNYMCIIPFKRYYFINDITHISNKLWKIDAHVDVLYSFMGDILTSKAIIEKSQNPGNSNLYYDDGSFILDSRKYNKYYNFPNSLSNNGEYVLICAGGE